MITFWAVRIAFVVVVVGACILLEDLRWPH
jgi:hypothetical protein